MYRSSIQIVPSIDFGRHRVPSGRRACLLTIQSATRATAAFSSSVSWSRAAGCPPASGSPWPRSCPGCQVDEARTLAFLMKALVSSVSGPSSRDLVQPGVVAGGDLVVLQHELLDVLVPGEIGRPQGAVQGHAQGYTTGSRRQLGGVRRLEDVGFLDRGYSPSASGRIWWRATRVTTSRMALSSGPAETGSPGFTPGRLAHAAASRTTTRDRSWSLVPWPRLICQFRTGYTRSYVSKECPLSGYRESSVRAAREMARTPGWVSRRSTEMA